MENSKQFSTILRLLELKLFDLYICMKSLGGNLTLALSCQLSCEFSKAGFHFKIDIVCACTQCRANEVDELDAALCLPKNMKLYIIYEVHTLMWVFLQVKNSDTATRCVGLSAICYTWTYVGSLQNPVSSHHYLLLLSSLVVLAHMPTSLCMIFLCFYCRAFVLNWKACWDTHFNKK